MWCLKMNMLHSSGSYYELQPILNGLTGVYSSVIILSNQETSHSSLNSNYHWRQEHQTQRTNDEELQHQTAVSDVHSWNTSTTPILTLNCGFQCRSNIWFIIYLFIFPFKIDPPIITSELGTHLFSSLYANRTNSFLLGVSQISLCPSISGYLIILEQVIEYRLYSKAVNAECIFQMKTYKFCKIKRAWGGRSLLSHVHDWPITVGRGYKCGIANPQNRWSGNQAGANTQALYLSITWSDLCVFF